MYVFVLIIFIFALGTMAGWGLEVVYRHLADKDKRWFNPGFCVGPWLPIYGIGLTTVYLMTYIEDYIKIDNDILKKVVLFLLMSIIMTLIELIGGMFLLKYFNLRLWDYTNEKFNYKGFICLKFSLFWMLLGAIYYFLIHPLINDSVIWLSKNLIFSFFVGIFFGVFMIDLFYSANVVSTIKKYAKNNDVVIKLEEIKDKINREKEKRNAKVTFFMFEMKENIKRIIKEKEEEIKKIGGK